MDNLEAKQYGFEKTTELMGTPEGEIVEAITVRDTMGGWDVQGRLEAWWQDMVRRAQAEEES
jgi:hypothetical protein